jgi:hypothetical protein
MQEEELESLTDSPILQSRPFTPLSFGSPAPRSMVESPSSRRGSDVGSYTLDDAESQAVASSSEDENGDGGKGMMADSGSAPQLVMPSIKMPSRRPFTEKGKHMGRLKVMIAGDTGIVDIAKWEAFATNRVLGVGKTSLIKAIVQTCEDIVHVDPLSTISTTPPGQRRRSRTKSRSDSTDFRTTSQITEVYASTRAYPAWWSDLEESRILRRRKSMGDSVLERNLCFVDNPGYGNNTSWLDCITPVVDYIEAQFRKSMAQETANESDLVNLISGNGGSQVDLVLYLMSRAVKPIDLEFLKRLSDLTNVVPILSFSDILSEEEIATTKDRISSELTKADIKCFTGLGSTTPFAISTGPSKDLEAMDASLLMSPDYVQPLYKSDLPDLVQRIFNPDTISWLRHSSAKKLVQWRSSSTPVSRPQSLYRPLTSSSNGSQGMTAPVGATTSYALARITDHTQREERIAQVRLANWAADLQRSLFNERQRYDNLARSERAVWLTERLGECVQDGTIVPLSQARNERQFDSERHALVKKGEYCPSRTRSMGMDRHDPLGLLQLNVELQQRMWTAVKVVSGFGILGGFAYWLAKNIRGEDVTVWGLGGLTIRDMVDFEVLRF